MNLQRFQGICGASGLEAAGGYRLQGADSDAIKVHCLDEEQAGPVPWIFPGTVTELVVAVDGTGPLIGKRSCSTVMVVTIVAHGTVTTLPRNKPIKPVLTVGDAVGVLVGVDVVGVVVLVVAHAVSLV